MTSTLPVDAAFDSADDEVRAQLAAVREVVAGMADRMVSVSCDVLAEVAAGAAALVAVAEAARAAAVLEAHSRGVIAASDHPRTARWVEQSCRDGEVPVTRGQARQLQDITTACEGFDVAALRTAVTSGRVPLESAARVATVFRRLKTKIDYPNWEFLLQAILDWAARGAHDRDLAALEDALIGQYGTQDGLDEVHAGLYDRRELTPFHRNRHGMLSARLNLDPASEAAFSAAVHALSAPHLDAHGNLDGRSAGQRRVDAVLAMIARATTPTAQVPGSGSSARITITVPLTTLTSGLPPLGADPADRVTGNDVTGHDATTSAPAGGATPSGHDAGSGQASPSGPDKATGAAAACQGDTTGGATPTYQADTAPDATPTRSHTPGQPTGPGSDAPTTRPTGRGYARTGYGQALSPNAARMLACDAHLIPAVLGTHSELLDLGRAKRLITPALRDALHLRDQGCTFPGCTAPPTWCDGHHITHWSRGGPTTLTNLALLCRHHHSEVHRHDHTATIDHHGPHWTRTNGRPIGNTPRAALSF